jgi:hypothetical protein
MSSQISQRKPKASPDASPFDEEDAVKDQSGGLGATVLKVVVYGVLLFLCSSQIITGTWTYGYEGKWLNWKRWIPVRYDVFS